MYTWNTIWSSACILLPYRFLPLLEYYWRKSDGVVYGARYCLFNVRKLRHVWCPHLSNKHYILIINSQRLVQNQIYVVLRDCAPKRWIWGTQTTTCSCHLTLDASGSRINASFHTSKSSLDFWATSQNALTSKSKNCVILKNPKEKLNSFRDLCPCHLLYRKQYLKFELILKCNEWNVRMMNPMQHFIPIKSFKISFGYFLRYHVVACENIMGDMINFDFWSWNNFYFGFSCNNFYFGLSCNNFYYLQKFELYFYFYSEVG